MSDRDKDGRISDASELVKQIASLHSVASDHRTVFVHDRLMSAIDDICAKHKNGNSAAFTPKQVMAIKDIAFHIVFIMDSRNHPRGFFGRAWSEFKTAGIATKITIVSGIIGIIVAIGGGVIALLKFYWPHAISMV